MIPHGLDAHDPEYARLLELAVEEWEHNLQDERPSPAIHRVRIDFVLKQILGLPDEVLVEGQAVPRRADGDHLAFGLAAGGQQAPGANTGGPPAGPDGRDHGPAVPDERASGIGPSGPLQNELRSRSGPRPRSGPASPFRAPLAEREPERLL